MKNETLPGPKNLYSDLPQLSRGEDFTELLRCRNVAVERILSSDRVETVRYDQEQDEWVILLEGRAVLEVAGEPVSLSAGDYIFLPAHTPHRVLTTSGEPRCIWLAVHVFPDRVPPVSGGCDDVRASQ
ncbi:MAG: cupin domain-containing protein [Pseudomonadota bacterium]|nr:cupin domain-containing protein [Pseudomonadota bacterium]